MEPGFYEIDGIGADIGVGVSGSRWATLGGVVKMDVDAVPYTVANEYICGQLAGAIGLPVPPATIAKLDDGGVAFVCLRFGHKGDSLPPVNPPDIVSARANLSAGLAIFDCWVINQDRHPGNLAFLPEAGLSVFDHGHALLGTTAGGGIAHLQGMKDVPLWSGCLVPHLKSCDDLARWVHRVNAVPDDLVTEIAERAWRLGAITRDEASTVSEVLNHRKRRLGAFVDEHHDLFPAITSWGLAS